MPMHLCRELKGEDRNVYIAWRRKILIAYATLILFVIIAVALNATSQFESAQHAVRDFLRVL